MSDSRTADVQEVAIRVTYPDGSTALRVQVTKGGSDEVITYRDRSIADALRDRLSETYPDHTFAVEDYTDGR